MLRVDGRDALHSPPSLTTSLYLIKVRQSYIREPGGYCIGLLPPPPGNGRYKYLLIAGVTT